MRRAALRLLPCLMLVACAEDPFLDHFNRNQSLAAQSYVQKEETALSRTGRGEICFAAATPMKEVQLAAQDSCAEFGLQPVMDGITRYQCRMTNPHVAHFHCVDPAMRTEQGDYVNVFDPKAVASWEKRTGKKAPLRQTAGAYMSWPQRQALTGGADDNVPRPVLPTVDAPIQQEFVPAWPAQTPIQTPPQLPVQTPTPALMVPAPSVQTPAVQAAPVPTAPLAPFNLPVGSWSDHF